ncbi:ATP-binding protein [Dyella silvae]|uniref:ATP-binding protein n=1 Tax=Dyella silvae TaxID=2994424 RepID=UPI0022645EF5|nr:transporter substrate-binding domain-containing protein [Dyella silvae]
MNDHATSWDAYAGKSGHTSLRVGLVRRILVFCVAVLLAVMPLAGVAQAAGGSSVALTQTEQDWVVAHPVVEVGIYTGDHLPAESWVAGVPQGLGVDYTKLLLGRLGLRPQFRPFSDWQDVAYGDGSTSGPFDLLVAQRTGANNRFIYLRPYTAAEFVLVARKGDQVIRDENDLTRARIAIERGFTPFIARYKARFPGATFVYGDNGQQALDMVASGIADAYIGGAARTRWLLSEREHNDLSLLSPIAGIEPIPVSLAVPKDKAMLAELLHKAEMTVVPDELAVLRSRWWIPAKDGAPVPDIRALTESDKRWLSSLGPLRLGFETDRFPYSFIDKDRKLDGLAADYVALLKKELGLRIELVPARDWDELQRRVRAKEVDLVAAVMPTDFNTADMVFSRPYEHFPEVIVARTNGPIIAGQGDLAGKKVAMRDEAGLKNSLKLLLPRSELVPVTSNEAGLDKLESGEVAAYVGTLPAIDALIRDRHAGSLRVIASVGVDQDIAFGVIPDHARLAALIDKVLVNVKDSDRQAIRSRWLRVEYQYGAPWRWVFGGLAIGALVVAAIGLAYRRLRNAESRARASERRLIDINDSLPGVILTYRISPDGSRTYDHVSGQAFKLFGVPREDILSGHASPFDSAVDEDLPAVQAAVAKSINEKVSESVEFRIVVDGKIRWIRALGGEPRPTPDGGLTWSAYCKDATDEKEQAQALTDAKAAAEAAVRAKSAFLAMMSHEIRTPMAGVLGLIELLSKMPLDGEQARMVGMVQDSAESLLQILDDILDFSRIEAERLSLAPAAFDLRALADGVMGILAARAREKGIRLHLSLDWRLAAEYMGDANRIRQIINNLLSNALKFTQQGYVALRIDRLGETNEGQSLRISVTDTGIGISQEQLSRLFQPFTQAEASTTRRYGGTGLGLTICRRLAHLMGGTVQLNSKVGLGTHANFEVTLPAVRELMPIPEVSGKKALVCSRDAMLERELSNAVSAMGFNVTEVDVEDLAELSGSDGDIYLIDADLSVPELVSAQVAAVRVVSSGDHQGMYVDDGNVLLCGNPLLWRSAVDACCTALGVRAEAKKAVTAPKAPVMGARILVAEDHPINQAVIERQLDRLGFAHTIVDNGQKAWDALTSSHYDLLVTDCHMPVLDGYALAQRIRASEAHGGDGMRHLPIVGISASAMPEHVHQCIDAGMDDFLAKPMQLDDLKAKIDALLGGDHTEQQASQQNGTDHELLAFLTDVFGTREKVRDMLTELLESSRADVKALDKALQAGDVQQQRELLHRLLGSLRLLGGLPLDEADSNATPARRRDVIVHHLDTVGALVDRLNVEG